MMFENGIDEGTAQVIGAILVFAGVVVSTRRASREGVNKAKEVQQAKAQVVAEALPFAANLDLTKYIREEVRKGVAEETRQLREDRAHDRAELDDVKRILGSVYGRLDRIRQAVRDYIADVRSHWGRADAPPTPSHHLTDLLDDVDGDTWVRARIQELRESLPPDGTDAETYG